MDNNSWESLGIRRTYNYKIFESKQIDDLVWTLKIGNILEYQCNNRIIRFKVIEEYKSLDKLDDSDVLNDYFNQRKSEILNCISTDGYKIIELNCSHLDSKIIKSLIDSKKYLIEFQDDQIKILLKKSQIE